MARLSSELFQMSGEGLRELHDHTPEAIESSTNVMAATKRNQVIKALGTTAHKLVHVIEMLGSIASAPSEGRACDEMALMLCDVLRGSHAEIYPVETTAGDNADFLRISHRP